ncbi:hypothetical protein H074_20662 [Amycolatopsis decaplanina DSM 44594]|uniref:Cupin type-2 domain-containing protein n=2 Tax=Amycolatopsis decaplanina TaxID=208441 RepID=M2X957_9PSEU|nr:hypothetical protein H074_20662 [Amycolatopsis decaplanina DSM 44594]
MGTITVPAHQFVAEHYHPYSDEFLFLVDGAITLRTGDDSMELNAGEAVMIPRGHRHRFDNLSDVDAFGVFHICPLAPRPEIGHVETEPVPFPDAAPPRVGGSR